MISNLGTRNSNISSIVESENDTAWARDCEVSAVGTEDWELGGKGVVCSYSVGVTVQIAGE